LESGLTRTIIVLVFGCVLVVGAAAASIVVRSSVPAIEAFDATASIGPAQAPPPTSNREGKRDRLTTALASIGPQQVFPTPAEPLRQAFASDSPADLNVPNVAAPVAIPAQKPKVASKPAPPPVQKNYTLLSDAQIASIKGRLNLTGSQESYWPAIEDALRRIARKMHEERQARPNAGGGPPIDPDSAEVAQLKSAAMPLLFQLREDQKREVRALARIIGLEAVASAI
jgi:hypothetical protein